jgi:ketol-acid reductoisomerase
MSDKGQKMDIMKESDASPSLLEGRKVIVMGYGNQGRPQALNLRDSGVDTGVAAREGGRGWARALEDGFAPVGLEEGARQADILLCLLPDELQGKIFGETISGNLREGAALCFAHGFAVAFGSVKSDRHDIVLVAPKGQGSMLRKAYVEGSGLPCLVAVENDYSGRARDLALAVAWGLGCLRVGAFRTSFREEAVSDIFGEQAVLCGGVTALVKRAWELLVRKGYSPEIAYFECCQELKIIVDLFTEKGFSGMREMISGTAAYGGLEYGEKLISKETERAMEEIFERINSGEFARDWLEKSRSGGELERLRGVERDLPMEEAGRRIRSMYGNLKSNTEGR